MGNFAHNINFFGDISCEEFEKNILDSMAARNYIITDNAEESDYSVAYIVKDGIITLYEDDAGSDFLVKELSKKIPLPTVVLDLLDSDCLSAVLMKNGRKHNTYISEPEMLEMRRTPSNAGNAARWKSVISDIEALDKIFKNTTLAEEKLYSLAELMGLNSQLASLDYRYLDEFDLGEVKYLHFVDKNVPPIPEFPILKRIMHFPMSSIAIETKKHTFLGLKAGHIFKVQVYFYNQGKTTEEGFCIYSYGECYKAKCIELTKLKIIYERTGETHEYDFEYKELLQEQHMFGYIVKDFHFPLYNGKFENFFAKNKKKNNYQIEIYGKISKPCHVDNLYLFIHPQENYYNGYFYIDMILAKRDFTE